MSLLFAHLAALPFAAAVTGSHLSVENCDLGEVYAFNKRACEISFFNGGEKPIAITSITPDAPEDRAEQDHIEVPPHAQAYLRLQVSAGNAVGANYHTFRFKTNEQSGAERVASARMFVMTAFDQFRPQLDFGVVESGHPDARQRIELTSHDVASFKLTGVIEQPDWLTATVEPDGRTVSATVHADAGWGVHNDFIKLRTDLPQQPEIWITAKGDVHGEVVPASNPYEAGLMRVGNNNELRIPLTSRSGGSFEIGAVELQNLHAAVKQIPCVPAKDGCKTLSIKLDDDQPPGSVHGDVWVKLPKYAQRLHLLVTGLLVKKDTKIKDFESLAKQAKPAGASKASGVVDLQTSIVKAVHQANDAVPEGTGPLIKWSVANGVGIHGFQIFRSDREDGPFVLLNQQTIRSTAVDETTVDYQYRDNTAAASKTYWYYVGVVYGDGHKQQLTGAQKVIAK